MAKLIRDRFCISGVGISIDPVDVSMKSSIPEQCYNIKKCNKLCFISGIFLGKINKVSQFSASLNFIANGVPLTVQSKIISALQASGRARYYKDARVFVKCYRIGRKTAGLSFETGGNLSWGAKLKASDFAITQIIANTYLFTFKIDVDLIGKILISGCKERYWPEMLHKVAWNKSSDLLQIVRKRDEKGVAKYIKQ